VTSPGGELYALSGAALTAAPWVTCALAMITRSAWADDSALRLTVVLIAGPLCFFAALILFSLARTRGQRFDRYGAALAGMMIPVWILLAACRAVGMI